jgi:hypothetical protein
VQEASHDDLLAARRSANVPREFRTAELKLRRIESLASLDAPAAFKAAAFRCGSR